jgi:hypothetical protein
VHAEFAGSMKKREGFAERSSIQERSMQKSSDWHNRHYPTAPFHSITKLHFIHQPRKRIIGDEITSLVMKCISQRWKLTSNDQTNT